MIIEVHPNRTSYVCFGGRRTEVRLRSIELMTLRQCWRFPPLHPVPSNADLEWLRGNCLDVVSTAEFTMWFVFDSTGTIQAEDTVELIGADGNANSYNPQTREGSWPFHKVVGARKERGATR